MSSRGFRTPGPRETLKTLFYTFMNQARGRPPPELLRRPRTSLIFLPAQANPGKESRHTLKCPLKSRVPPSNSLTERRLNRSSAGQTPVPRYMRWTDTWRVCANKRSFAGAAASERRAPLPQRAPRLWYSISTALSRRHTCTHSFKIHRGRLPASAIQALFMTRFLVGASGSQCCDPS